MLLSAVFFLYQRPILMEYNMEKIDPVFIDSYSIKTTSTRFGIVYIPATKDTTGKINLASSADNERAIDIATNSLKLRDPQPHFSHMPTS